MKKLFLLPVILLFTAATYGPPFSVSDFSSLTNRPNPSSVNPVGVVLGKTNAYDGNGGIFVFTPSSTNAVDGDIYLTTTTTGRWVRLTRDFATISSPLVLSNGTLSLAALTNYFTFLAGTNMQVIVTSNTVTYAMTNTTGGGSGNLITVNGGLVTNFWDNGYITFLNAGGGDYSLNIGDDTISTNKINSTFYNWVLSLSGGGGGTTNGLGVNGTFRTDWNAINSAEIAYTVSAGTNWYGSLVAGSVAANKLATTGTGTSTNFLAGDYSYKYVTTNMIPGLNAILATIGSGGGSGGGIGTNFILNGVMKQPAIITNGLSVIWSTNANGHVQAEVSLVDTNIPSTIARLDSPTFTGTVTFDTLVANTLQVPFASRYAAANSSSNLIATSDGASWTNLNGSSIATGTVADARIDAALARLASPTFTGDPKAPTASPGDNDTSIASTAFVTAAVAAGGGSGGTGTVVTASGGSDMSRANITTNGFGLLVTQSGTNILLSTTNNYPVDYYAGGFLPLFAGLSNALTGDLHYKQSSDIRSPMWESGTAWNAMGMRASGGVWSVAEYNTNDFTVLESFITIDPTDTTGPTDIITFPNSGFNNKVVFDADVEFNGTVTGGGLTETQASLLYQGTNSTLTRVGGIGAGTTGDLLYRDATGWTNLAKGTQGQYLAVTATVPAWSNAPAADVQVFSAVGSNTWTKPSGKTMVYVLAIGGGGGGGAGRRGAAGTIRSGGAGGAPGGYSDNWLPASALGSTETVTVGGGGAGASVQTSNDANGSNGTSGTNSTFGNWVFAGGGFSGGGGDADGATASTAGYGKFIGPIGAASSATGAAGTTANGSSTSSAGVVPSGGGSGGGITSGNSASNGGAGGEGPRMWRGSSQLPGGTAGSLGGSGGAGNAAGADVYIGGSGGGGGASSISDAAGAGGYGGAYGAGGGGGGASLNGNNSGAGGTGGNGIVVVISY